MLTKTIRLTQTTAELERGEEYNTNERITEENESLNGFTRKDQSDYEMLKQKHNKLDTNSDR